MCKGAVLGVARPGGAHATPGQVMGGQRTRGAESGGRRHEGPNEKQRARGEREAQAPLLTGVRNRARR